MALAARAGHLELDIATSVAGDDPFAAARYANAAAALQTTGYGAVAPLPRHAEVMALLAEAVAS